MDRITEQLLSDAGLLRQLKELQEKRKEIQNAPEPRAVSLGNFQDEIKKSLEERERAIVGGIVKEAFARVQAHYDHALFFKAVLAVIEKNVLNVLWPRLMVSMLPIFQIEMEKLLHEKNLSDWDKRTHYIDEEIRNTQARIPQPFDPGLINRDVRFPVQRIGWENNKPYDKWLTERLGSKKPIFFSDPDYVDKLIEFHRKEVG